MDSAKKLLRDVSVILHKGGQRRPTTLPEETMLKRIWDLTRGDILVVSGRWKGWTFCENGPDSWMGRYTES